MHDGSVWDGHDHRARDPEDCVDDPDVADGFQRSCCRKEGSFLGCKSRGHKVMESASRKRPRN